MNVEQLRKQAKELVKAARAGDEAAVARLGGREPILARAQLVIAREQGYSSWAALVVAAEASVDSFVSRRGRPAPRAGGDVAGRTPGDRPRPVGSSDAWARPLDGRRLATSTTAPFPKTWIGIRLRRSHSSWRQM